METPRLPDILESPPESVPSTARSQSEEAGSQAFLSLPEVMRKKGAELNLTKVVRKRRRNQSKDFSKDAHMMNKFNSNLSAIDEKEVKEVKESQSSSKMSDRGTTLPVPMSRTLSRRSSDEDMVPSSPSSPGTGTLSRAKTLGPMGPLGPALKRRNSFATSPTSRSSSSRPTSPGGFLPKVRGITFSIVEDHPFFKGTSEEFRQAFFPHVSRRYLGVRTTDPLGPDIRGLDRQGVFSGAEFDFQSRDSQVRMLVSQGADPSEELDGLILTDLRFDADLEMLFDGHVVASMRSNATFGAEMAFGVTKKSAFGLRIRQEPTSAIYFISRADIEKILNRNDFSRDVDLLKARIQQTAGERLQSWLCSATSRVKVRLFTNVSPEFKSQLLRKVKVRLVAAGMTITEEGAYVNTCLCVFLGEASVSIQGKQVSKLTHDSKASAWAAWWGFLEASGTCKRSPACVTAITDCTVWDLSADQLKDLRTQFPAECGFFDKVAVKHIKMIAPFAGGVWEVPVLRECAPQFVQAISLASTQRICLPGETVVRQDDHGTEMFVLVRGQCSVYRSSVKVANIEEGNCFGELAVLGISNLRTATITTDTVCDLRVLDRDSLLKALSKFPEESSRMQVIAEAHGYGRRMAVHELKHLPDFQPLTDEFIQRLAEHMYEQAFFVGQTLAEQDAEQCYMYILVRGQVVFEMGASQVCEVSGPAVLGVSALVEPGSRALHTVKCSSVCEVQTINAKQVSSGLYDEFPQDMESFADIARAKVEDFRNNLLKIFHTLSTEDGIGSETEEEQEMGEAPSQKMADILEDQGTPNESRTNSKMSASFSRSSSKEGESSSDPPVRWQNCFFADSDKRFLKELSTILEKRIFFDGQVMLQEGDSGHVGLLLQSGAGVVEVDDTRVAEVKRGDLLGEVVLLGFSEHYTATIKAAGLVTAYAINKLGLRAVLEDFPDEQTRLEEVMKKRVKLNRQLIDALGTKDQDEDKTGSRMSISKQRRSTVRGSVFRRQSSFRGSVARSSVARESVGRRSTVNAGKVDISALSHLYRGSRSSIEASDRSSIVLPGSPRRQSQVAESPRAIRGKSKGSLVRMWPEELATNPFSMSMGPSASITSVTSDGSASPSSSAVGSRLSSAGLAGTEHLHDIGDCDVETEKAEACSSRKNPLSPRLPGRANGQKWVDRRKEALRLAAWRKKCAQARVGDITEILLPSQGYSPMKAGFGRFEGVTTARAAPQTPAWQLFRQAESVYGKPVWHEVFGDPNADSMSLLRV